MALTILAYWVTPGDMPSTHIYICPRAVIPDKALSNSLYSIKSIAYCIFYQIAAVFDSLVKGMIIEIPTSFQHRFGFRKMQQKLIVKSRTVKYPRWNIAAGHFINTHFYLVHNLPIVFNTEKPKY